MDSPNKKKLLTVNELEQSCVVANNRMNRERAAVGSNGYEVEIGFNPIDFLLERYQRNGTVRWLDLCCGQGLAMIETALAFLEHNHSTNVDLVGVDLVNMFARIPDSIDFVFFENQSLSDWQTMLRYDLITCVHGLHLSLIHISEPTRPY